MQEEPQNMGSWKVMFRRLPEQLPEGVELRYMGARSALARARATRRPTARSRNGSCSRRSPASGARGRREKACASGPRRRSAS